jgi:hypothetical protein
MIRLPRIKEKFLFRDSKSLISFLPRILEEVNPAGEAFGVDERISHNQKYSL